MLPHKLHEFATSVRGAVNMEDVPREFLSISLNDHGKELFLSLSSLKPPVLSRRGRRMMRGGRVSVRRKVTVLSGVVIRQRPRIDQDRLIPNPRRRGIA